MKTVWKFELPSEKGMFVITLPLDARILDAGVFREKTVLWALIDTTNITKERMFLLAETGEEIHDGSVYIKTIQYNRAVVLHLFELK